MMQQMGITKVCFVILMTVLKTNVNTNCIGDTENLQTKYISKLKQKLMKTNGPLLDFLKTKKWWFLAFQKSSSINNPLNIFKMAYYMVQRNLMAV